MNKALVVGAGAMGTGIAYIIAKYSGAQVDLADTNQKQIATAEKNLAKWHQKDTKKENLSGFIGKINLNNDLAGLSGPYDLLIEAASEKMAVKQAIFEQFNQLSHSSSLIASNTSSLSVTEMASFIDEEKRSRVLGLHFFNPPRIMKLLEIIRTITTSDEAISEAMALAKLLKKEVVTSNDAPGFITSRIGMVMVNEAIFALQEGLSTAEEIGNAMQLGYNHPMGPLELADFIGLDVVFAVTQSLYENYQDSKYRPAMLLRKKVEAGHLGRKTGQGFFSY